MQDTARTPVPVVARIAAWGCQAQRDILQAVANQVFVFLRGWEPEFCVCDQSD